jgi:hypothetical protein
MNRMTRLLAMTACIGVAVAAEAGEVKVIQAGPGLDNMKVTRDKVTGKIRPATAEEIAEMGRGAPLAPSVLVLSRPTTTMVTRPDGSATIRRSIEDLDSLVAARGADGKLIMRHSDKNSPALPPQSLPKE